MRDSITTKTISFLMAWTIVFAPTFQAMAASYDYGQLCTSTATAQSDQTKSYCTQAATAITTQKFQTTKEILMVGAGVAMTAMAFIPGSTSACKPISYATDAAGLGIDVAQALDEKSLSSAMLTGVSTLGAVAVESGVKNSLMNSAVYEVAAHTGLDGAQGVCLVSAGLAFAQGAFSMAAVSSAKKAENSALSSVTSLNNASSSDGVNISGTTGTPSTGTSGSAGAPVPTGQCSGSGSGSALLSCMSAADPQVAALAAGTSKANLSAALGGQSLGDLAKNYTGDGSSDSVAGYVGGAMGLNPEGTAALKKSIEKAGEVAAKDGYSPAAYTVSGDKTASTGASPNLDFGQMMKGMLKTLAPTSTSKKEDPSDVVFRQLDLLPASKIESNKDISLFARIGYRYRKQSMNVDQLNYSSASNQAANTLSSTGVQTASNVDVNSAATSIVAPSTAVQRNVASVSDTGAHYIPPVNSGSPVSANSQPAD